MNQQQPHLRRVSTAPWAAQDARVVCLAQALWLAGLCLSALVVANTLPALPLLPAIALGAFAPVVALTTKLASNAKRSLLGAKPSAGGQS
jgi:hypothetical protein